MAYQDGLKQAHSNVDPLTALRAPVEALLGVSESAGQVLRSLGLDTVFDLATSPLFTLAHEIAEAAAGRGHGAFARLGVVSGGAVFDGGPDRPDELAAARLDRLRSLQPAEVDAIEQELEVETIGDLGRWLPFRSAHTVLAAATVLPGLGEDEAEELVPRLGEFPTERRYYSTIVLDQVATQATVDLVTAGPIDIAPTVAADFGFSAPAVGARLTFEQSWYAHGVTLGNLLHSIALSPGESTRIAVVDWSRRTAATAAETIAETEALTNISTHNRAVSEVQNAVANEVQSGFSHSESKATTKEAGGGFGFSMGPVSLGGSAAIGTTTTSADSFSTSVGSRDLAASMSQQVMDATQQAASSVRNRRASIVKEVSEAEHESVSTRIIANYNHMHALTVQYYEVVETYRVLVALNEVERCLFVPMKLVEFNDAVIRRYQGALAAAALNRRARELLTTEFGLVRLTPVAPTPPFRPGFFDLLAIRTAAVPELTTQPETPTPATATTPTTPPSRPAPPTGGVHRAGDAVTGTARSATAAGFQWDPAEIRRASRMTAANVIGPSGEELFLPRDAEVEGITVASETDGPPISAIALKLQNGQPDLALVRTSIGWRLPTSVPLQELAEVVVTTDAGDGRFTGRMTLELSYRAALFPVTIPLTVAANTTSTVARIEGGEVGPELVEHLQANRLHYSQAIWRSLDASTVALLLSQFRFEGQLVANIIDPRPIHLAGNYMVFRMPGFVARPSLPPRTDNNGAAGTPEARAHRAWTKWLQQRGLRFGRETTTEQLVPVPTGGVFAEAVLGRSNSAERLDATRFWNWQDSPIPLQPPEIAAINLASRAQPVDVQPGQLGQPVLNIVNPTGLPDPTGLAPMLGALQSGNVFRDMSGLAATIGLAQSTASDATGAAADAARLAAANLAVAAQKDIEQQRIAAQLAMTAMGGPTGAMAGTPKNVSEMGALINAVEERDRARAGGGVVNGGPSSDGVGGLGGFEDGGGGGGSTGGDVMPGPGGGGLSASGGARSLTDLAYGRAMFGGLGVPAADVVLARQPGTGGSGGGSPQFAYEAFFFSRRDKDPGLDTPAKEVAALEDGSWTPSTEDFEASGIGSGARPPQPTAVSNVREFLKVLAEPAFRFYFFGYLVSDDVLGLDLKWTGPGTPATPAADDVGDPGSSVISLAMITAFREVGGLSTAGGELGRLLRDIRRRNKQHRDTYPHGQTPAPRQLWLAVAGDRPSDLFAKELAKGLQMTVFLYRSVLIYGARYSVSPPRIRRRGVIELSGFTKETDVHKFDLHGEPFDP